MTHENRITKLLTLANRAQERADRIIDPQIKATWARIADSCHDIVQHYRNLDREKDISILKL